MTATGPEPTSSADPAPTDPPPPDPPSPGPAPADRPPAWARIATTVLAIGGWAAIVVVIAALVTTVAGRTVAPAHAVFQMALPFVLLGVSLIVLFAALTRRRALIATSGLALVVTALLLAPAVWPRSHPAPGDRDLTVFVSNLRYNNQVPEDKVAEILAADDDVVVLVELTPDFVDRLEAGGIDQRYPYRSTHPEPGAHGAGIYSKRPIADAGLEPIGELTAPAVTVETADGPLRVVAVHTRPPVSGPYVPVWEAELRALHDYAAGLTRPTVLAGDFNATRWHPGFKAILDLGLTDAHEQVGKGLTFSWPVGGRIGRFVGPFSRLDHALLAHADATAVDDRSAAGSDHRAFVLRVRPRPAGTLTP